MLQNRAWPVFDFVFLRVACCPNGIDETLGAMQLRDKEMLDCCGIDEALGAMQLRDK